MSPRLSKDVLMFDLLNVNRPAKDLAFETGSGR